LRVTVNHLITPILKNALSQVQVTEELRGKGIGKFLMQILELIGSRAEMKKIMITVFKHNPRAQHFFNDILKYVPDFHKNTNIWELTTKSRNEI